MHPLRMIVTRLFLHILLISILDATQCGLAPIRSKRIVGGTKSAEGVWPWQISLLQHNSTVNEWKWAGCGGTLIGNRWALTAAHCFIGDRILANYSVLIGSTYAEPLQDTDEIQIVKRIFIHPTYGKGDKDNDDIALLELEPTSKSVVPVCLSAKSQRLATNIKAVATGYGASMNVNRNDRANLTTDMKLRAVTLKLNAFIHCGRKYELKLRALGHRFVRGLYSGLCAGDRKHGTHEGDSGGPLMIKAMDGRWVQIGITSYSTYKRSGDFTDSTQTPSSTPSTRYFPMESLEPVGEGSGISPSTEYGEEGSGVDSAHDKGWPIVEDAPKEVEKIRYVKDQSSFTKVRKYCDWIKKETEGEVNCIEDNVAVQEPPNFTDSSEQ